MYIENKAQFNSLTQASYYLRATEPQARLYILLHGYMSKAEKMIGQFKDRLPSTANLLIPNGPFPIPIKRTDGYSVGYSWNFFNSKDSTYLVGNEICSDYLKNLVGHLGFVHNPKTVIGFSQGGYVSVHVAKSLRAVDHIIGIGCQFKIDQPNWHEPLLIEGIHGNEDEIVDLKLAQEKFHEIPQKFKGRFEVLNSKHKPSEEVLNLAGQWATEKSET